jgi:uncharacterized protein (DUF2249 family)
MFKTYLKQSTFNQIIPSRHYARVLDIGPFVGSDGNFSVGFNQNRPKVWRVHKREKKKDTTYVGRVCVGVMQLMQLFG